MKPGITILVIIYSGMFSFSSGQPVNQHFDHYNFENGLSSNRVQCMAQDSDGFLWIGTASGLNRFDGNSFVHYYKRSGVNSLSDNGINDIVCLPGHKIAIATSNGLSFLDTHAGTFFTFRYADTSKLTVVHNYFKTLCLDARGNLWAGTGCDIFIFNRSLRLIHSISSGYTSADVGRKVIAWNRKISKLPGDHILAESDCDFDIYDIGDYSCQHTGSPPSVRWSFLPSSYPKIYMVDVSGRMWFLHGPADSLFCFNWNDHTLASYPLYKGASSHFFPFGAIYNFSPKLIYFYLADAGLYLLRKENGGSTISYLKDVPADLDAVNFFCDRDSNLWIGGTGGLYESSPVNNQFQTVVFPDGDKNVKTADNEFISRIHNDLWVASYGNGFYRMNLQTQMVSHYRLSFRPGDLLPYTWNFHEYNQDTILIGTLLGLIWFDTSNVSFGRLPYAHPGVLDTFPITTQFTDHTGIIWMGIGAGHGVIAFNPQKKTFRVYNQSAFPLRHPTAITEDDDGNLWMATQKGGGLVKWIRKNDRFVISHASPAAPFIDEGINCLHADHHGRLWIGTSSSGLVGFNLKNNRFTSFEKENGLSYERIDQINTGQYPYLWIITAFGLNRLNTNTNTIESFYANDGLPSDQLSSGNYFDAASGMMYLGWQNGLILFDAKHFYTNEKTPAVFINEILANGVQVNRDLSRELSFRYDENNLSVNFTAVDLVSGSDLKFRYRINEDMKWIDLQNNRQINFSNLSPGKYKLLIAASNKSGAWNDHATSVNFSISSPFWKTAWFYALIGLCGLSGLYLLYGFRLRQLMRVHEMRNRIAHDLHDDIGGTLTAMNLTNELAMQQLNDQGAAKKLMMNIGEDLHGLGESLDDIVWMVNPKNDSMPEVVSRMRRYASRTWEAAGIEFTLNFETAAEQAYLNMEQRHDLYLVFKEAVNNAVKHSGCTQAFSSLALRNHSLVVEVKDNGKGFESAIPSHRNGMGNMKTRIEKWGGDFKIHSASGEGTIIHIQMPLTQKGD